MSERTRTWWNVLGKLVDWLRDNLEDQVSQQSSIRSDTAAMRSVLDEIADQASYAMALVDMARDDLSKELRAYDLHMARAQQCAGERKENETKRCLFLARRSKERIALLTEKVKDLQQDADVHASTYQQRKIELEKRHAVLPDIERQLIFQQTTSVDRKAQFDDATRSFDAVVAEVDLAKRQQKNRVLLTTDPHQAIDKSIVDGLEQDALEKAYSALLDQVGTQSLHTQETMLLEDDVVSTARMVLANKSHEDIVGDLLRTTIHQ